MKLKRHCGVNKTPYNILNDDKIVLIWKKENYIIIIMSFMHGIYTYIPETSYVPREYSVAAILLLLFVVLISLVSVLNLLYFYILLLSSSSSPLYWVFIIIIPRKTIIIIIIIIDVIFGVPRFPLVVKMCCYLDTFQPLTWRCQDIDSFHKPVT